MEFSLFLSSYMRKICTDLYFFKGGVKSLKWSVKGTSTPCTMFVCPCFNEWWELTTSYKWHGSVWEITGWTWNNRISTNYVQISPRAFPCLISISMINTSSMFNCFQQKSPLEKVLWTSNNGLVKTSALGAGNNINELFPKVSKLGVTPSI